MRRSRPPDELPVTGLTKEISLWIESIDPEVIDSDTRAFVSGLVDRMLNATAGSEGDGRQGSTRLGLGPVVDAHLFAAGLRAETLSEQQAGLMELAAPVVGAVLAIAVHHPCSGASLGAAVLAGCELGLLLAEMAGAGSDSRFRASAATCAAVSAARVLDLSGDRLVSAIGIGASSSVGAAFVLDAAWQAGKSASNGVLAALLADADFTGPADAIEHPRGLLGAVFDVRAPAGKAGDLGNRIGAIEPLISPAGTADGFGDKAAGMWEMERASDLVAAVFPDRGSR